MKPIRPTGSALPFSDEKTTSQRIVALKSALLRASSRANKLTPRGKLTATSSQRVRVASVWELI